MAMGMDMGMMGAPEPDADEMGGMPDMDADDPGAYEPKDEFEREAMSAFDDSLPMADRMIALREAIKLCGEEDYGSSEKPAGKKPGVDVLLAFGGPKKKG